MNWIDLVVGAIIGAFLGELVAKPLLGPTLASKITYYRKLINKIIQSPEIPIQYVSNSRLSSRTLTLNNARTMLTTNLEKSEISSVLEGNNIRFEKYVYGKTISRGIISFDYNEEEFLDMIEVELTCSCRFKKLPDDLTGLSNAMSNMKEIINSSLKIPINYDDYLMCHLNNVMEIYGLIGGEKLKYINISGDVNFDFSQKKVTFYNIIGPETIRILKKLIVLYY